jgi:uncharacterized protein DUF3592
MESIPIRNALGYGELFWSLRQWLTRRRSSQWSQVLGTVEGYELLMASQNGWLVVFYSYELDGRRFSGEWRKWLLFSFSSVESQTGRVTARLPVGARIGLRVDPSDPSRSIAEPVETL